MAYLFVPFSTTLDDLEGHSPNAGLIKCNSTNICETFSTVLIVTARRAVLRLPGLADSLVLNYCSSRRATGTNLASRTYVLLILGGSEVQIRDRVGSGHGLRHGLGFGP